MLELWRNVVDNEKRLTVAACHELACQSDAQLPPGCAQRLEDAQVGQERWQGLAESIELDLASYHHAAKLARFEEEAARLRQLLQEAPVSLDGVRQSEDVRSGAG